MLKLSVIIPVWNQEELVIRALDHLPRRDDIEILVRDDGSTDATLANLQKYKEEHPELNLTIYSNGENKGVAYTKNLLLKDAAGEYVHIHDSDDYVYTDLYNYLINNLEGDIVCMNLEINDGSHFILTERTQRGYCAQIARFIRREFIEGIQFPEGVYGDDWYFAEEMLKRDPRIIYSYVTAYHYNYPREDSLYWRQIHGVPLR